MKYIVLICARGDSKGLPGKNIKPLNGTPLIGWSINIAKKIDRVSRIIVSTDSEDIAKIAITFGAEVPFLRFPELATDDSKVIDSIICLLGRLNEKENYTPDYLLLLQPTSPLREVEDIERCWQLITESRANSVFTICETRPKPKDLLWVENDEVDTTSILSRLYDAKLYGTNGFVFLIKVTDLLQEKAFITGKVQLVMCPEWRSIDIDVEEEWKLAEILYDNKEKLY